MCDPLIDESPTTVDPKADSYTSEFDSLQFLHTDSQFYPSDTANVIDPFLSDVGLGLDNGDFELTFDALDDNLYLPSEIDDFLVSDGTAISAHTSTVHIPGDHSSGSVPVSGGCDWNGVADVGESNDCSDVAKFLNYASSESSENSGDHGPISGVNFNSPSPDSGDCDRESSGGPVLSQGSGNCGSAVLEGTVLGSDSENSGRVQIKVEEVGKVVSVSKRKKEQSDTNNESRSSKYRRSVTETEKVVVGVDGVSEEEEKRKARLMRNRESAQLSRQRKKHYVEELEDKVRAMHSTIADFNSKVSFFMAENAKLRHQLGGGGMCPPPPPHGMYPPMPYPWMSCPPYVVKPQGSQVSLVPIPRLKLQQPLTAPTKSHNKKAKKVASISFLSFFLFILLFGGLAPIVNVKFGGTRDEGTPRFAYVGDHIYHQSRGKLLTVNLHSNGSDPSTLNSKTSHVGVSRSNVHAKDRPDSDEFVPSSNASEPLVASLYVPRNDKLVKIDGNLIIHSVLSTEKAMASHVVPETKSRKETGLAIPKDLAALAIPQVGRNGGQHPQLYRKPTDRQKALSSGSTDTVKDHYKSSAGDGKLQQWFREGLAGPLLSSGMCTEVFHFDATPTSGAIIPASSVANISAQNHENVTSHRRKNRRFLHGLPVAVAHSNLNVTQESMGRNPEKDGFQGNKSVSSMVVSILIDPREVGNSDSDGVMGPKSLSRIFVVVLMDSVKYVTYSCMVPRSVPQLVTT